MRPNITQHVESHAPVKPRMAIAMSGGVDSSLAAALLVEQGYDVVGLTLQLYDHGAAVARKGACCAGADIHDARRVAAMLDIPHYVLDYQNRFRKAVMDDFADSYLTGQTPVPCIRCNEKVKFRDLLETARNLGAQSLATGHYIRRLEGAHGPELHCAADDSKDQSYFLFTITPEQLDCLRFPLGGFSKQETRQKARDLGLSVADKADSQDICFVPGGHYADIIKRLRPAAQQPGDIVHVDGRHLGRHDGIIHFTVGQRRGLGVTTGEPLYVVRIDAETSRVVAGPKDALLKRQITLSEVNWLGDCAFSELPSSGMTVRVKVRSTRPPAAATLFSLPHNQGRIVLHEEEYSVAPGQACVFYDPTQNGSRVLGGGWIVKAQ
ncbi:MAG: tRNA 2-thiouridine(34) synthase MnmA [Parvularculales bacterium]